MLKTFLLQLIKNPKKFFNFRNLIILFSTCLIIFLFSRGAGGILTRFITFIALIGFILDRLIKFLPALNFLARIFYKNTSYNINPPIMDEKEARDILGVTQSASKAEIKAAYHKHMKKNHPDNGGSKYIAEKLNQARDILLKKL